jgi:hypothetical protein
MTINFPVRVARGNGTTVHEASHPAERQEIAAASRVKMLVPVFRSVRSATTLTAAQQKYQRTLDKIR